VTTADTRPLLRRLFEPRNIHTQALVPQVATYLVLLIWSLVVIIPPSPVASCLAA